jgi:hypothetical protein
MSTFEKLINEWTAQSAKWEADEPQIDEMLSAARAAKAAPGCLWAAFRQTFIAHSGMTKPDAEQEVRKAQIAADLGRLPFTYGEFVAAFIASRGLQCRIDGTFALGAGERGAPEVFNDLVTWTGNFCAFNRMEPLRAAWSNWKTEAHRAALLACYERVQFDPSVDPSVIDRLVALICADQSSEHLRVAKAVIANFIYRVKNHMRGRMHSKAHVMPYLRGKQGGGKTTVGEWLFAPIEDAVLNADFDIFEDRASMIDFSLMPVVWFDEMAQASRQDAAKVKGVMTTRKRQFRQLYQEAGKAVVISSFFGCGNVDISDLFKDATGLRRFFEIVTPNRIDRATILDLDALVAWRSVDENAAVPPIFVGDIYAEMERLQDAQRVITPVEEWVQLGRVAADEWIGAHDLFSMHFEHWRAIYHPKDSYNSTRFGREMRRLIEERDYDIEMKVSGGKKYRFGPNVVLGAGGRNSPQAEPNSADKPSQRVREIIADLNEVRRRKAG